jgi:hypothetical protein
VPMKKFLLLLILGTVVYGQQLILTQDTISDKSSFNYNPFVIKDSGDKIHLVYTNQFESSVNSKDIFYTEEEADSFRTINLTNNEKEENYPCISLDKKENAHITFLGKDTTFNVFQIEYINNVNGYFTEPVYLTFDGMNKTTPVSIISPDSVLHVVYFTYTFSGNGIFYIRYNLKTGNIVNPYFLGSGETDGEYNISMALDKNGKVHIVFKTGDVDGGELKYFVATNWKINEIHLNIKQRIVSPKILVDVFNKIYILYKDVDDNRLYLLSNQKGYFDEPLTLTPLYQNPFCFNNFSIDGKNRLYFVYQSKDSSGNSGIFLVHGSVRKFSEPIQVQRFKNGDITANSTNIVASANGEISIIISETNPWGENSNSDLILRKGRLLGNAIAQIEKKLLVFEPTKLMDTSRILLKIKNSGKIKLKVFSPLIYSDIFSIEMTDTLYIEPDSVKTIGISFQPTDSIEYNSILKLKTNSLFTKSIAVNLSGKGVGLPVLSLSRDTLVLMEEKGFIDSVLIINKGASVLRIDSVKNLSGFAFVVNLNKSEIESGDSLYIRISNERSSEELPLNFIDSVMIYSNDPYRKTLKLIITSSHYTLKLDEEKLNTEYYRLDQNYPNPFNPQTTITFTISVQAHVILQVFDALAREIATLVNGILPAGIHNIVFDGENLSTGVYYYKLFVKSSERKQPDYIDVKKMILVK